jgi:DnaA family protein
MKSAQQLALDVALRPEPTLHNFCVGANAQAWAHLQDWLAGAPAACAAPSYLWGESGCGKTHLLRAVQTHFQAQGRAVGWLQPGSDVPAEFEPTWAAVLMDDVQVLDAPRQHTAFNWLVNATSAQVPVLAAGCCPVADLPLRDDVRSRLGWGLVFALQALPEAQLRAVLHDAAHARGLTLSDEVLDYVLHRFSRDLGSLMALLDQLDAYALQTQRALTIPLIKSMLESL